MMIIMDEKTKMELQNMVAGGNSFEVAETLIKDHIKNQWIKDFMQWQMDTVKGLEMRLLELGPPNGWDQIRAELERSFTREGNFLAVAIIAYLDKGDDKIEWYREVRRLNLKSI